MELSYLIICKKDGAYELKEKQKWNNIFPENQLRLS